MPPLPWFKSQIPREVCFLVGYKSHCPRGCLAPALEKQLLLSMRHQQFASTMPSAVWGFQETGQLQQWDHRAPWEALGLPCWATGAAGRAGPAPPGHCSPGRPGSAGAPGCRKGHRGWAQGKSSSQGHGYAQHHGRQRNLCPPTLGQLNHGNFPTWAPAPARAWSKSPHPLYPKSFWTLPIFPRSLKTLENW